jgi:DNA-binding NtrC family response regulator
MFQIHLPPLRKRKEDIPALAEHFLEQANAQFNKNIGNITNAVIKRLKDYDWPGNVRELKNVIYRAAIVSKGRSITLDDISILLPNIDHVKLKETCAPPSWLAFSDETSLDDMEKEAIQRMLDLNRGNKRKTAEALGIGRSSLYWKLKKYGLS